MRKLLRMLFLLFVLNTSVISTIGGGDESTKNNINALNYIEYDSSIKKISAIMEEKDSIAYHNWDSIPIYSPLKTTSIKRISSDYGYRFHPIYKHWHKHQGIDFTSEKGTNVLSTATGVVKEVRISNYGYGNQIIIQHSNGYKTRYAHLERVFVKKGQHVCLRDVIGTVGNTGLTTGTHLHYEILKNNKAIDPMFHTYKQEKNRTQGKYFTTMIALEKY